ncbi:MAG TPA: hypothetical protein VGJ95_15085 [Pseudonocardiaceae bacterium]
MLHVGPDNVANIPTRYSIPDSTLTSMAAGPDAATLGTGDTGGRYACGVVERIQ